MMAGLLDQYGGMRLSDLPMNRQPKTKGLLNMLVENPKTLAGLIADFTPVVGDVKSAYDGVQSAREGDWLGAGLGALGALPFVPAMGGVITKHTDWPKIDPKLFNDEKFGKAKVSYTVHPGAGEVDIGVLRVPQSARGSGEARRAMQELLGEVDAAGYTAKLGASPLDKKTNLQRLVDFYSSLGFSPTGRSINGVGDPEMMRPPSKTIR
ncbi:MAG: hypothetical protein IPH08_04950 [Rhodocyclaceae bacterium]|nr:hypothetical protein [Rhodocyclaceae bacterium]